ncbi:spermatogenesis-associated serine-rich protein 1 isoform X4 [Thunnus thynnus]|uniref:spermatogenesis-associated serine-rich protein 1 isoform X4 n=1 Tax=Thunnus thynnus TaxID=8237 RepID=UPI0035288C9E
MEQREQCTLNPGLRQAQAHNIQAEETCPVQDSPLQTTEVSKSRKTQRTFPCHGAVGARPYCSPEYSPDFYKLDSTLPHSKFGTMSHMKTDTFIPLQPSTKTLVPYLEKKKLLDKEEEIQEVKQLDEWKPAVGIFTAVLEGLDDKAS